MAEDSFTLHLTASAAPGTAKPKGRKTTTKKQRRKAASLKYAANAKPQLKIKKGVVVARPAAEPASVPRRRDKPAAPPTERTAPPSPGFGTRKDSARVPDKQYGTFHLSAEELSRPRPALIAPVVVPVKVDNGEGFASLGVGAALPEICTEDRPRGLGLRKPTQVQVLACEALTNKRDALVVAPTGSGKTLSYALPIVADLVQVQPQIQRNDGTVCLVVAPTRELGVQISQVFDALTRRVAAGRLVAGAITGGEKRKAEKARLRKGVGILVATPGRLLDHLRSTVCLTYKRLRWIVLDEVDRLLDLGFGPQVDDIIDKLREGSAQIPSTVLVTATVTSKLQELATKHLKADFATVDAQKDNDAQQSTIATPATLVQAHAIVTLKLRPAALCAMLRDAPQQKTLVFVATCASCQFHAQAFSKDELRSRWGGASRRVSALHGKLDKESRRGSYDEFCRHDACVLFATDIAARGLDFASARIDRIIHLDAPRDTASYVHRSGRAARAGRDGSSILLLLPSERPLLDALRLRLSVGSPDRAAVASQANFGESDARQTTRALEGVVDGDEDLKVLARDAFAAQLRAYAGGTRDVADAAERALLTQAFHVRKLHLGHCAKAFGLRETPAEIGRKKRADREGSGGDAKKRKAEKVKRGTKRAEDKKKQNDSNKRHQSKSVGSTSRALRASQVSEFGA
jgi:ATP-dependent RNA helicase DDX31/DBP7